MTFDDISFGTSINVISKSNIRYEGVFENFDESTLMLSNVISHGTENRFADKKVEPSNKVYKCIRFKGDDIAEISLVESEFVDPAIINAEELHDEKLLKQEHNKPRDNDVSNLKADNGQLSSNTNVILIDNMKFGLIANGNKTKFYKPFELNMVDTEKPNLNSMVESNTSGPRKESIIPIIVTPKKKNLANKSPNRKIKENTTLMKAEDSVEPSSDNCAQYISPKPYFRSSPLRKNVDILTMEVKEFNFENGPDIKNNETNLDKITDTGDVDINVSRQQNLNVIPTRNSKTSYNANNSFFDGLSLNAENEHMAHPYFLKNNRRRMSNSPNANSSGPKKIDRHRTTTWSSLKSESREHSNA